MPIIALVHSFSIINFIIIINKNHVIQKKPIIKKHQKSLLFHSINLFDLKLKSFIKTLIFLFTQTVFKYNFYLVLRLLTHFLLLTRNTSLVIETDSNIFNFDFDRN